MASAGWSTTTDADIKKKALLMKIKTARKKLFVLRDEGANGPARLEYFDNERKFKTGGSPKRCIVLKNCLSINAKTDSRHRYAIFLYTKDDCFGIAFDTEADQQDWLAAMIDLRNQHEDSTLTKPLFEHIWPVTLKSKGLASKANLPTGPYHLCLTNTEISLIRLNHDDPPITLLLDCIRRCGHSHEFFFIELGRQAFTGAGELWLHVGDNVISQNMHEAILNAMQKTEPPKIEPYRPRTHSNVDGQKKRGHAQGGGSFGSGTAAKRSASISVHSQPSPSLHRFGKQMSSSENYGRLDSNTTTSSIDEIDAGSSGPGSTRSMTPDDKIEEEIDVNTMNLLLIQPFDMDRSPPDGTDYQDLSLGGASSATGLQSDYMMMPGGSSSTAARSRTSLSEADAQPYRNSSSQRQITQGTVSAAASSPASSLSDYMEMASQTRPPTSSSSVRSSTVEMRKPTESSSQVARRSTVTSQRQTAIGGNGDYAIMNPTATEDGYMDMKAGTFGPEEVVHGSSGSVSSAISQTSGTISSIMSSRSGAVETDRGFHSLSRLPEMSTDGYIEMSPQNVSSASQRISAMSARLNVVRSYLREDDVGHGAADENFPKRAYSVGSKPEPSFTGKPLTGGSYVDMSGAHIVVPSAAHPSQINSLKRESEKSSSAPHLNDDGAVQMLNAQPEVTPTATGEIGDLFMELDFNRKGGHHSKDFRDRTSSGGSRDLSRLGKCSRTLSYSAKDALARLTVFRGYAGGMSMDASERRPRTSTICQESLRPRTSSFGANVDDSRPRSSSGGNARLRDVFGHDSLLGANRLGVNTTSVKHFSAGSSIDSLNAGADYTDMFCTGNTSRSSTGSGAVQQHGRDLDEYVPMQPGESTKANTSEYMPMEPPANRKELSRPTSEISSQRSVEAAANSSDYMSMRPGEPTPPVKNVSDYMDMRPGEAATTAVAVKVVSDYMPMEPSRKSTSKSSASDVSSTSGPTRPCCSVSAERPTSTRVDPTIPMPFRLEASQLHYAAAAADTAAVSSAASVPSTSHPVEPSPYFAMGGPRSEVSYATLDLARNSRLATVVDSSVVSRTALGPAVGAGADTARSSQHVYAEIDFGRSDHSGPST